MNDSLRSYTGRRKLIEKKLSPYIRMEEMVPTNMRPTSEAAEMFHDNSLWCSWGDRETGSTQTVTVSICHVADGDDEANDVRNMIKEECAAGLDVRTPNSEAYEITVKNPDENVFVLNYLGRVTAIVDNCLVDIWPSGTKTELSDFAEVALDIGRSIGCSAYENDFTLPEYPGEWRNQSVGWSTPGFPPYFPGLSDPKDPNST